MGLDVFGLINNILTKNVEWSEEVEAVYNPFLVNRAISQRKDCLFYAEAMNRHPTLSKEDQFLFYKYAMPKTAKKYIEWGKKDKVSEKVGLIAKVFGMSIKKAQEVEGLLTNEQMKKIVDTYTNMGGLSKSK